MVGLLSLLSIITGIASIYAYTVSCFVGTDRRIEALYHDRIAIEKHRWCFIYIEYDPIPKVVVKATMGGLITKISVIIQLEDDYKASSEGLKRSYCTSVVNGTDNVYYFTCHCRKNNCNNLNFAMSFLRGHSKDNKMAENIMIAMEKIMTIKKPIRGTPKDSPYCTVPSLFTQIDDKEFLSDYHTSYLLTTNGHAFKSSVIHQTGVTKVAYCMAEGQLVVVTMNAYKCDMSIGGVNEVCGLSGTSTNRIIEADIFYAVYRDGTLRAWNTETQQAHSVHINKLDPSIFVEQEESDLKASELRDAVFNVDHHPFDVVFRAVQVDVFQIACEGSRCECSHGDWSALSTHIETYLRSPEFDAKYMERGRTMRLSSKDAQAEAEKKFFLSLASACDQLEQAARGPIGLAILDVNGACLVGVVQQDRFSVVREAPHQLVKVMDTCDERILDQVLLMARQKAADKECSSDSDEQRNLEPPTAIAYSPKVLQQWMLIMKTFTDIASVNVESEGIVNALLLIAVIASLKNEVFGGSFTCGLIAVNLRQAVKLRLAFAHNLLLLLDMYSDSGYPLEDRDRIQLFDLRQKLQEIRSGCKLMVAQLDIKLSSWFLAGDGIGFIRCYGGAHDDSDNEKPQYNSFVDSTVEAAIKSLWFSSPSLCLARSLVTHEKFPALKKLCNLSINPPAHLIPAIRFYNAIAYSGIGQPQKAMHAFNEASLGISAGNKALFQALGPVGKPTKDFTLGEYYTTTRIYVTLFNHLVNRGNWDEALMSIHQNKDSEIRRMTLRELMSRMLHARDWKTIAELNYGNLEEQVSSAENILLSAARTQDVTASPHIFELVFSYYTYKLDYENAARAMYEYSFLLRTQAVQTPELLRHRRDALAAASNLLDLLPEEDRFLSFPDEVNNFYFLKFYVVTVPPCDPNDIISGLIEIKQYDAAFDVCRQCEIPVSDVLFAVTREAIMLDADPLPLPPEWIQENRRHSSEHGVNNHWSVARGLLKVSREVWPTDSRPLRAVARAFLSHSIPIPCWLHAEYMNHDVGDYLRCLIDYDSIVTALSILTSLIEEETHKVNSVDSRTWLPYTVIDETLNLAAKNGENVNTERYDISSQAQALISPLKKQGAKKLHSVLDEFYGVYCLISRSPLKHHKNRCYIGYTVDPNRRIQQHNGGREKGGAKKTDSRGPWDMVCIIHGFPNSVAALRFEWAWQNPDKSRAIKGLQLKKLRKETPFAYRFRVACHLMNSRPWCRFALTFRWLIHVSCGFLLVFCDLFTYIIIRMKNYRFPTFCHRNICGNQRDLAREKNLKKQLEQKKKLGASGQAGNVGLSTDARKNRDAEAMRLKQEKAATKKAAEDAAKAAEAKKMTKIDPLKM
uniref:GIY-YIG domain-containing protein n=1 Tax=Heterorhabditis bacteriophora TaxID=37862 RepID=A0A1I7XIA7_HETBA